MISCDDVYSMLLYCLGLRARFDYDLTMRHRCRSAQSQSIQECPHRLYCYQRARLMILRKSLDKALLNRLDWQRTRRGFWAFGAHVMISCFFFARFYLDLPYSLTSWRTAIRGSQYQWMSKNGFIFKDSSVHIDD